MRKSQVRLESVESSGGFTGVVLGLYSVGENTAVFENFALDYQK